MEIRLCVIAWEETPLIPVQELVRRLRSRYPTMLVDWKRGDAFVQTRLEQFVAIGAAEVILKSHRTYFGNTAYVSIREEHWSGATVTAWLQTMRPPLGDAVCFDVMGTDAEAVGELIAGELGAVLGMVRCSDIP